MDLFVDFNLGLDRPGGRTFSVQRAMSFADLEKVHDPGVSLAVWGRVAQPMIVRYLEDLERERPRYRGFSFKKGAAQSENLEDYLVPMPSTETGGLGRGMLHRELRALVSSFLGVSRARFYHLRFEKTETDACRLFHTDLTAIRLLCTYKGPGTQYLKSEDVLRAGLGGGCNEKIVRPGGSVHSLETGDVALLKGDAYPGEFGNGVVHRSPTIEGLGLVRWVLRIDAPSLDWLD